VNRTGNRHEEFSGVLLPLRAALLAGMAAGRGLLLAAVRGARHFSRTSFAAHLRSGSEARCAGRAILLGLPAADCTSDLRFDLRILVPHFLPHAQCMGCGGFCADPLNAGEGNLRLSRNLPGELCGASGLITDLPPITLYEATLRRSSSFFHKHATGSILSTLINDVDKVQIAAVELRDRRILAAVLHLCCGVWRA